MSAESVAQRQQRTVAATMMTDWPRRQKFSPRSLSE
jgi:hypothetical protein